MVVLVCPTYDPRHHHLGDDPVEIHGVPLAALLLVSSHIEGNGATGDVGSEGDATGDAALGPLYAGVGPPSVIRPERRTSGTDGRPP